MNRRQTIALWVFRLVFVPVGLALLAVPIALLGLKEDWALVDDTRALAGAGTSAATDPNVPVAHGVSCTRQFRSLRSTDRGGTFTRFDCDVYLAPSWSRDLPTDDPFKGRPYDAGMAEWQRRTARQMELVAARSRLGSIPRAMVTDHDTDGPEGLPEVRRLSAVGAPAPRYGLVWGAGGLLLRWLAWLASSLVFFGIGGTLLYIAWRAPKWRAAPQ